MTAAIAAATEDIDLTICGRTTRSGAPCKNIRSGFNPACTSHMTPYDKELAAEFERRHVNLQRKCDAAGGNMWGPMPDDAVDDLADYIMHQLKGTRYVAGGYHTRVNECIDWRWAHDLAWQIASNVQRWHHDYGHGSKIDERVFAPLGRSRDSAAGILSEGLRTSLRDVSKYVKIVERRIRRDAREVKTDEWIASVVSDLLDVFMDRGVVIRVRHAKDLSS